VEERAGERRSFSRGTEERPSVLSPLLRRGARKKILAAHDDSDEQQCRVILDATGRDALNRVRNSVSLFV
jgi:hypothetical protein